MKEVCKAYFVGREPTTCDPPDSALWWVTDSPQVAGRGLLTYRPAICCCCCSSVAVYLRSGVLDVQLHRV